VDRGGGGVACQFGGCLWPRPVRIEYAGAVYHVMARDGALYAFDPGGEPHEPDTGQEVGKIKRRLLSMERMT
jgi:hypothetical protein